MMVLPRLLSFLSGWQDKRRIEDWTEKGREDLDGGTDLGGFKGSCCLFDNPLTFVSS